MDDKNSIGAIQCWGHHSTVWGYFDSNFAVRKGATNNPVRKSTIARDFNMQKELVCNDGYLEIAMIITPFHTIVIRHVTTFSVAKQCLH